MMETSEKVITSKDGSGSYEPLTAKEKALHNYVFRSMKRAHDMFLYDYDTYPENDEKAYDLKLKLKTFYIVLIFPGKKYGEIQRFVAVFLMLLKPSRKENDEKQKRFYVYQKAIVMQ
jgi:hypothetical protein